MRPMSFWERAQAAPADIAVRRMDGSALATRQEIDRAGRNLLAAIAGGREPSTAEPGPDPDDQLAHGLIAGVAPSHLEMAVRGLTADADTSWAGEHALRSWGQLVCVTSQRAGVRPGPFLLPGTLDEPVMSLIASWGLHTGCEVVVPDAHGLAEVGEAVVRCRPTTAVLPQEWYEVLRDFSATAEAIAAIETILVPVADRWNDSVTLAGNVQPVRVGPGPMNVVRAEPGRRAFRSFWEWVPIARDELALDDRTTGEQLSFGELDRLVESLIEQARAFGGAWPPILVSDPARFVPTVAALLAAQRAGFYGQTGAAGEDIERLARSLGDDVLSLAGSAVYVARRVDPSAVDGGGATSLPGAHVMQTSGSTGPPKLIIRRQITADPDESGACAAQLAAMFGIPSRGCHVVDNHLVHGTFRNFAMAALHHGNQLAYLGRERIEPLARWVAEGRVTSVFLMPHRLRALVGAFRGGGFKPSRTGPLASVIHGGERIVPADKFAAIDLFGPIVHEIYSTSEGNGTLVDTAGWLQQPGSVGWPMPGAMVRVVPCDGDGDDAPAGAIELWTRHTEYVDGSPPLRGWFRTGDRGWLDRASGALHLTGRDVQTVSCRDRVVPSRRIVTCIEGHPDVYEAAVTVAGHGTAEEVVAVVIASPTLDVAGLRAWLAQRLPEADLPARIEVVEDLPRLGSGKIDWGRLHSGVWLLEAAG